MSETKRELLPVLPLRDMVVFPHGVHPLFVGTKSSIVALDSAMADDKQIFLVAKKDSEKTIGKKLSSEKINMFGTRLLPVGEPHLENAPSNSVCRCNG